MFSLQVLITESIGVRGDIGYRDRHALSSTIDPVFYSIFAIAHPSHQKPSWPRSEDARRTGPSVTWRV